MIKQITSTQNPYIKEIKALKRKKGRINGKFLCEGEKCVLEALEYANVDSVIISGEHERIVGISESRNVPVYYVTNAVMEAISDTKSQQGAVAVINKKDHALPSPSGIIVALENVSDPQNVGTIIRTADAAGASCIILSELCADYCSPKAVRASMGSIFHIPIVIAESFIDTLMQLKNAGMSIIGTHLKGSERLDNDNSDNVVVIGNEARGMSDEAAKICTALYKIPMKGNAESLNAAVAAGIVIYKLSSLI